MLKSTLVLLVVYFGLTTANTLGLEPHTQLVVNQETSDALSDLFKYYFKQLTYISYFQIFGNSEILAHVGDEIIKIIQKTFAINLHTINYELGDETFIDCENFTERRGPINDGSSRFMLINDEPEDGYVIFVNIKTLNTLYFESVSTSLFGNPRGNYMMMIFDDCFTSFDKIENLMDIMWTKYQILDVLFVVFNSPTNFQIGLYDPFVENEKTRNKGIAFWQKLSDMEMNSEFWEKRKFHQHTLRCSIFYRNPTAINLSSIDQIYTESYMKAESYYSKDYIGIDGLVLANLAKELNLNIDLVSVDRTEYGYQKPDGNFTGTLFDVLHNISDIAINSRFVTFYNTSDIEFVEQVGFDSFCIVVPKALKIPQWIAVLLCFDKIVWIIYFTLNVLCGFIWYFLKRIGKRYKVNTVEKTKSYDGRNKCLLMILEMWNIALGCPSIILPKRNVERIFMASFLMSNIIIIGTFQGTLTTAYSTTTFYKDINTLEELDKSGLPIGTSAVGLKNIFSDDNSSTFLSLNSKLRLLPNSDEVSTMSQTAFSRDLCSIERKGDVPVRVKTKYQLPDGTSLVHMVNECPRLYYLAYIVRKGSPFLPQLNILIRRYGESGLLTKWYDDTEMAIINHHYYHVRIHPKDLRSFSVSDMQMAFLIISIGLALCSLVFIVEILMGKFKMFCVYIIKK